MDFIIIGSMHMYLKQCGVFVWRIFLVVPTVEKCKKKSWHFDRSMVEVITVALIWSRDKFIIFWCPVYKVRVLLYEFVGCNIELDETKE